MTEAWLAFGGNVGDSRTALDRAVVMLCNGIEVRLTARSSDYRTLPWGVEDQPSFINLGIAVETTLSPRELLARTQAVERALGRDRRREQRWGPRTVDIDIIAFDDVTFDDNVLILPHPRALERAFVLAPLAEIKPDGTIGGVSIKAALANIDKSGVERLPPR